MIFLGKCLKLMTLQLPQDQAKYRIGLLSAVFQQYVTGFLSLGILTTLDSKK
jgi:predicted O-linked N-acetylglucosamine transferase (SPINDLY family)